MLHRLALVMACVIVFSANSASLAQGTSGALPDPITTHELKGYADRLRLSDSQRQAAQMIHDQYKQEFRSLREGEIAEFLKEMRSMQGGMVMPKRQVIETFLKKLDHLNNKIAALDNRMFDQMQSTLTEDQMAMMPRVRMARQRTRYTSNQMMWMTGNRAVDLSEVLQDIEVTPERLQTIDPMMGQYEGKLTSSLDKLNEASTTMMLRMFDALEQQGFTEQSMSDPETAQKLGEVMQQIWRDITMEGLELTAKIAELNHRTYKSLAPLLDAETARTLRDRYYTQAYPEAGFTFGGESPFFKAALKLEQLTAEQRDLIVAARDEAQRKIDRIAEEVVALVDNSRKEFSPFDFNSEKMKDHHQKLTDYQAKVLEATEMAVAAVNAALGTELAKKIADLTPSSDRGAVGPNAAMQAAMAKAAEARAEAESADSNGDAEGATDDAIQAWSGDQFLPAAISQRDLSNMTEMLKLSDEQRTVLNQLHATYLESWKTMQEAAVAPLTKAAQGMWHFDEDSQGTTGPTTDVIEQVHRLRDSALDAIRGTDTAFFDDVEMAVLEEPQLPLMHRVRMMRERFGYTRGHDMMGGWFGGSSESTIDLSQFLLRQPLSDEDRVAIETELVKYEEAATAAFRERFDASLTLQRAQETWQAESVKARQESDENAMKQAARYQEIIAEPSKRLNQSNAALTRLNHESLERVLAALPAETARGVRNAYNRRAFPKIYNDQLSVDQRLIEAQKFQDLGPEQQRRLSDLAAEYRPAYDRLCEQMVQITAGTQAPNFMAGYEADQWKDWQERQEKIAGLKFERNELNLRTIDKLKALLSEDHIRRLGGLPQPKKSSPYDEWLE